MTPESKSKADFSFFTHKLFTIYFFNVGLLFLQIHVSAVSLASTHLQQKQPRRERWLSSPSLSLLQPICSALSASRSSFLGSCWRRGKGHCHLAIGRAAFLQRRLCWCPACVLHVAALRFVPFLPGRRASCQVNRTEGSSLLQKTLCSTYKQAGLITAGWCLLEDMKLEVVSVFSIEDRGGWVKFFGPFCSHHTWTNDFPHTLIQIRSSQNQ